MSDMQRDNSQPNKFFEVIHNGVIDHVNDSMGPDLSQELAMVVIPGDLVDNGPDYASWKTTFFDPASPVSYTHLRAHETVLDFVCRLLLEKKKHNKISKIQQDGS